MMGVFHRSVKGKTSVQVRSMMSDFPCTQVERWGCSFRNHCSRNASGNGVNWQFTADDARIKLKKLYPQV